MVSKRALTVGTGRLSVVVRVDQPCSAALKKKEKLLSTDIKHFHGALPETAALKQFQQQRGVSFRKNMPFAVRGGCLFE